MKRSCAQALLLSLAFAASTALADDDVRNLRLFATASRVTPLDDSRARLGGRTATVEAQGAFGWEAGLEWRITRALGVEVSLGRSTHDLEFGGQNLGQVRFEPVCAALDVHMFQGDRVDFWVAPAVIWLRWSADGLRQGVQVKDDRQPQLGATVGADWSIDETWAVTTALRYVNSQLEFGGGGEVSVDPLTLRLGIAARF